MKHSSPQPQQGSRGRNISKLIASKLGIQILAFMTVPIVTRLFLPEQFGNLQIFDSVSRLFIVLACFKYELSIPLAKTDREAISGVALSFLLTTAVSGVLMLIIGFGGASFSAWFNAPNLRQFFNLLPIIVFIGGLSSNLEFWLMRDQRFGAIAWAQIGNFSVDRGVAILWALVFGASTMGLFAARILGIIFGGGALIICAYGRIRSSLRHYPTSGQQLWEVASRHKKFPLFNTWSVFLNTLSTQLPVLLLGRAFSIAVVGYFGLAQRVINLPMKMLSDSIAKVFFSEGARAYHEQGTLAPTVRVYFLRLVQIGVFPMITLILFSPFLFTLAFGEEWTEAGVYARLLSCWYCLVFISLPKIFIILNRQEINFMLNVLTVLVRAGSLLIGIVFFSSARIALGIFTLASIGLVLTNMIWQLKLADVSLGWSFKTFARYILISYLLLIPAQLALYSTHRLVYVLGLLGLGTLGYGILLLKIDRTIRQFVLETCKTFKIPTGILSKLVGS